MTNGRIIKPNSIPVDPHYGSGPLAHPVIVTVPTPEGIKILALGGLTKLEQLAGQIAAASCVSHRRDAIAEESVDLAEAILAECERRQQQKPNADRDQEAE